jgi:hypothetical protein
VGSTGSHDPVGARPLRPCLAPLPREASLFSSLVKLYAKHLHMPS